MIKIMANPNFQIYFLVVNLIALLSLVNENHKERRSLSVDHMQSGIERESVPFELLVNCAGTSSFVFEMSKISSNLEIGYLSGTDTPRHRQQHSGWQKAQKRANSHRKKMMKTSCNPGMYFF